MQTLVRSTVVALFIGGGICQASAAFTSFYVLGDGLSSTTNKISANPALYYGSRYCNGRVWVEVFSQWQGLAYFSNRNWSYFGHTSTNLVSDANLFAAPDANTALVAVWVNNADFVDIMYSPIGDFNGPSHGTNLAAWNNSLNQSLTNHFRAITNLYGRGVRTLILPTAADLTKTYAFPGLPPQNKTFVRQRVIEFNAAFTNSLLNQIKAVCPALTIYVPDIFTLLDNMVANPPAYSVINPGTDAIDDPGLTDYSLNGPGADYLFWDYLNPSARTQMWIADVVQRLLSPPALSGIAAAVGSNRIDTLNVPIGRNGWIDATTDFTSWSTAQSLNSTGTVVSTWVPVSGPMQFYRVRFPYAWTWP